MKNIGIVTWYGGSNYGTSLQAYALAQTIEELGAKTYLLKKPFTCRNWIGDLIRRNKQSASEKRLYGLEKEKEKKISAFRAHNFNEFSRCVGYVGGLFYKRQIARMGGVISGSDQLWNPSHTEPFLLLQGMCTQKFSYASSIGVTEIPTEKIPLYKEALLSFEMISVREETAKPVIEKICDKSVTKVIDPTLLLEKEEWIHFAEFNSLQDFDTTTPYILCYFIADRPFYWKQVEDVMEKASIRRVVVLPMQPGHFRFPVEIVENAGIYDFVHLINHASLVCTDSFHATAISINLNREFVTFKRFSQTDSTSQNSRIEDLLQHYRLSERIYYRDTFTFIGKEQFAIANHLLETDRRESKAYLKAIIERC